MANKIIKPVSAEEIRAARNNGSIFPTPKTITRNATPSSAINRTPVAAKSPIIPIAKPVQKSKNQTATPSVKPVSNTKKNPPPVKTAAPSKTEIKNAFDETPLVKDYNPDMGTEYIEYLKAEAIRNKAPANLLHGEYVNKLKADEIKKIFLPFGYIAHEQMDKQIYVICKDFDVMLSDFTLAVDDSVLSDPRKWLSDSKFNCTAFKDACDQMGLTLEQALDEHFAIWMSERFHSYSDDRKNYKEKAHRNALKEYSNSGASNTLIDIMRELKNRQDVTANTTYNRGRTGYYNPVDKS